MTEPTDSSSIFDRKASALADDAESGLGTRWGQDHTTYDGDQLDREERAAMRRVAGLSLSLIHI